jgi:hypothetical protein
MHKISINIMVRYTLLLLTTLTSSFLIAGDKPQTNEFVSVKVAVQKKVLKAGSTGELIVSFKPKGGIHINVDPPVTIKLDSSETVTSTGKTFVPAPTKEKYLDITKPVKQQFTIAKTTQPGKITLKGIISYFYCSGSDGWCSRFKQPFEIPLAVTK